MQIEVESGWENAVESVLGEHLEAVCVDDCQSLQKKLPESIPDSLILVEREKPATKKQQTQLLDELVPITDKIKTDWALNGVLNQVYCVHDLNHAQAVGSKIKQHQSLISAKGVWIGSGWIIQTGDGTKSSGILVREKQLRILRDTLHDLTDRSESIVQTIDEIEQQLSSIDLELSNLRATDKQIGALLLDQTTQLASQQAHQEQINERVQRLETELADGDQQLAAMVESKQQQDADREVLSGEIETLQQQYTILEASRDEISSHAIETMLSFQKAQETVRQLESQLQMLDSTEQLAHSQMQRSHRLQEQAKTRINELEQTLKDSVEPLQNLNQQLLENKQLNETHEQTLNQLRGELEVLEQKVVELTTQRNDFEQKATHSREMLEQARIDQQACQVRRQTVLEQLADVEDNAETVLETLPDDATITHWQSLSDQIKVRIDKLGTVNLAAIEEVNEQSQRLDFLNEQYDDLQESLNSLEQAISKIDNESKARFRETFDNINQGLKDKFPRLFGGGRAQLDLSDNDLMIAGVKIMAQPPGKRNSSIHLLSGGEKALTAVALVFSIFELNPAPFCLLDEVDAPLDDANVGRFGAMLQEMSKTVQFIAISHNKATMEICKQMIGVTMKEAGVSRIVAVDIDEAVEMAVS